MAGQGGQALINYSTSPCPPVGPGAHGMYVPQQQPARSQQQSALGSVAPVAANVAAAQYAQRASATAGSVPAPSPMASEMQPSYQYPSSQQQPQQQGYYPPAGATPQPTTQERAAPPATAPISCGLANARELMAAGLQSDLGKRVKTRRYDVDFDLNLSKERDSTDVAMVIQKQHTDMFRVKENSTSGRSGELKNTILVGARVMFAGSEAPIPLGVSISGIRGNTYHVRSGFRGPLILHPGQKINAPQGYTIHKLMQEIDARKFERYGGLTKESLRRGVYGTNYDYSYVEKDSPIIAMMRRSEDRLKIRVDAAPLYSYHNGSYQVDNKMIGDAIKVIEDQIDLLPSVDMGNFAVKLHRLDGLKMCDHLPESDEQVHAYKLTQTSHVFFTFEFDFVIVSAGMPSVNASANGIAGKPAVLPAGPPAAMRAAPSAPQTPLPPPQQQQQKQFSF